MPSLPGGPELIFILLIVLIIFGAGRLPEVFGQLGKGVRTFREETNRTDTAPATGPSTATTSTAASAAEKHCTNCGKALGQGAKFCGNCGTPVAGA